MKYPPHFDGKHFFNPNAPQARGLIDVLRWKLTSRPKASPKFVNDVSPTVPPRQVTDNLIQVTMVNHSTVLLQLCGLNILSDPIWAERASPLSWAGPRRRRAPGIRWNDLPPIHLVLLTHNHYDHCDVTTLQKLSGNPECRFIVARGLKQLMASKQIGRVDELDWGDAISVGPLTVQGVPALHFSARSATDRNRTLWCGYVLQTPLGTIYFGGDTAFGEHFAVLREQFGAPRLTFLPIGAYEPRWFMSAVHMAPEEALRAAQLLQSETTVAIHHGTFQLADEALDTPAQELRTFPGADIFTVLSNGESLVLK